MTNPLFDSLCSAQKAVDSLSKKDASGASHEQGKHRKVLAVAGIAQAVLPIFGEVPAVLASQDDVHSLIKKYILRYPVLKPFLRMYFSNTVYARQTYLYAKCNTGFGHHLYIRGNARGLSWDKGVQMQCVGEDLWTWETQQKNFEYKILFDDNPEKGWEDREANRFKKGRKSEIILPTFAHFNKHGEHFSEKDLEILNKIYAAQARAEKGHAKAFDASPKYLIKIIKKVMHSLVPEGLELFDENQSPESYALQCILKYPLSLPFLIQIYPFLLIDCIPHLHPTTATDPLKLGALIGELWKFKKIPKTCHALKASFSKIDTMYPGQDEKRKLAYEILIKLLIQSGNTALLKKYIRTIDGKEFLSSELAKIQATRNTLKISEVRYRINAPKDLLEIFLIALSQSEFSLPFSEDYYFPNDFCTPLIHACILLNQQAPIEKVISELTHFCTQQKWEGMDSELNHIRAIKNPQHQKRALICLAHFLGCCLLEEITPAQFSHLLKLQPIEKLSPLRPKGWLIAIKGVFKVLKDPLCSSQTQCIYRETVKALTSQLIAQGLSSEIALKIEQCLDSKPFAQAEPNLQLIHLLAEWLDCALFKDEHEMSVIGERLAALISSPDAGSLAARLEIFADALSIFEKDAFLLSLPSDKELFEPFLNQLRLLLGLTDVERFKELYGSTLAHPDDKKILISYLKKIIKLPRKERNKAIQSLNTLFATFQNPSFRAELPKLCLDPRIEKITAQIFDIQGFMKEAERDNDHALRDNETLSEVQGTSTFCKKIVQLANQTPAALSPTYLRNYERLDPTCLTLRHKRIGHTFSLKGKIHLPDGTTRSLEGANETFFLPMLRAMFESFASKRKDLISDSLRTAMSNALSNNVWHDNVSDEKIAEIHKLISDPSYTDPIILGSGWDWHSTQLVFRRIKGKLHLCCCNCGSDHQGKPGVSIFYIKRENKVTPEFLKRIALRMNFTNDNYTSREKIQEELDGADVFYLPMKEQKAGNCVLKSLKAVFLAIVFLEDTIQHLGSSSPAKPGDDTHARKVYKELFWADTREILEDFLIELSEIRPCHLLSEKHVPYLKTLQGLAAGVRNKVIVKFSKKDKEAKELLEARDAIQRFQALPALEIYPCLKR